MIRSLSALLAVAAIAFGFHGSLKADVIIGDAYDIVTGIDTGGGFGFGVTGYTGGFTFDGAGTFEAFGTDPTGGATTIQDFFFDNGDGTATIQIFIDTADGSDLFPTVDATGAAITNTALFFGGSFGGSPLEFAFGPPTLVDSGQGAAGIALGVFGFDVAGANTWGFRLAADGDTLDFNAGLGLGTAPIGAGTDTILLEINYLLAVPEPASATVVGLVGLVLVGRRRRK